MGAGFELARFFVNEFHTFFGELKDKLDGIEGTVGTGTFNDKAKTAKKVKRTRTPSAFNIFVREVSNRTPTGFLLADVNRILFWPSCFHL